MSNEESKKASKLIFREETHEVLGAAMEVQNVLGYGLLEKPYENALAQELRLRGIPFMQQQRFQVTYKDTIVGEFVPDLIVNNRIIIDAKVIDNIQDRELGQMMNYLKITGLRVGLILNFRHANLDWKRIVL